MNYFWFSPSQRDVDKLYPELSLLIDALARYHGIPNEKHRNFVMLEINGERVETEYTNWTTTADHGCKWPDMVLLGTVEGEPEIRIEYLSDIGQVQP